MPSAPLQRLQFVIHRGHGGHVGIARIPR
jgi:hypothetical protein